MPAKNNRQSPQADYSGAPKNIRNFAEGKNIIPQGIIEGEKQANNNIEHIIKYLHSDAFARNIESMIDAAINKLLMNLPEGGANVIEFDPSATQDYVATQISALRSELMAIINNL